MRITGTWVARDYFDKLGEDVGIFMLPSIKTDLVQSAPGGIGKTVVVSKDSKNPAAAAQFIDYIFSKETAEIWHSASLIPPVKDVEINGENITPLFKEIAKIATNQQGLAYSLDVLMPRR